MESDPGAFPILSNWRALENSSGVKSWEILSPASVSIFQSSETSLATTVVILKGKKDYNNNSLSRNKKLYYLAHRTIDKNCTTTRRN